MSAGISIGLSSFCAVCDYAGSVCGGLLFLPDSGLALVDIYQYCGGGVKRHTFYYN